MTRIQSLKMAVVSQKREQGFAEPSRANSNQVVFLSASPRLRETQHSHDDKLHVLKD